MLLAAFSSGLIQETGKQVRFRNPQSFDQALAIALSVHQAESQEKHKESFTRIANNLYLARLHARTMTKAGQGTRPALRIPIVTRATNATRRQGIPTNVRPRTIGMWKLKMRLVATIAL